MDTFKKGDRVKVKGTVFAGVVEKLSITTDLVILRPAAGDPFGPAVPAGWLELAEPSSWPPQVGDIWEAGDHEYCVRLHHGWADEIVIEGIDVNLFYRAFRLADFMALNPVLVRRRGA